jgi:pimeloyl-ACP methyl ester carboxylesterase
VALDQRGHGESEWSPEMDYGTESHARDVGAFVDALKLERFVLVGMSLGGVNGLAWAGRNSQRLAGLVVVDVGPEIRTEGVRKIAAFTSEGHAARFRSSSTWSARSASIRAATVSSCGAACCTTSARCPTAATCGSTTSATAAARPIPTRYARRASSCGRRWTA